MSEKVNDAISIAAAAIRDQADQGFIGPCTVDLGYLAKEAVKARSVESLHNIGTSAVSRLTEHFKKLPGRVGETSLLFYSFDYNRELTEQKSTVLSRGLFARQKRILGSPTLIFNVQRDNTGN